MLHFFFFLQRIHRMLTVGIESWAPKLSVKKTVIYFLSQNRGEEMHTGHLRSTFIGETLARILEYSGVVVIRKRINDEDPLNINLPDINHLCWLFKRTKQTNKFKQTKQKLYSNNKPNYKTKFKDKF
jgi:hypothetical protein